MIAILVAFPLLMLATLVYVGLASHDETAIAGTSAGQTGCVKCATKQSAQPLSITELSPTREHELIAA